MILTCTGGADLGWLTPGHLAGAGLSPVAQTGGCA
jgi:hypothetical protein